MTLSESNQYYQHPEPVEMELVFSETGQTDITITNEQICSEQMSLEESLCSDEQLMFGACESSCFKVRIVNSGSFEGKTLTVTQKISQSYVNLIDSDNNEILDHDGENIVVANRSGTDTDVPFGIFKVFSDKPSNDRMWRDLVCYDAMYDILNADVTEWFSGLTFPMTIKDLRDSFFEELGIDQVSTTLINDSYVTQGGFVSDNLAGKTIIEAICELNACFGHITRDGKFEYICLPTSDTVTLGFYKDGTGTYEDYTTDVITGVVARSEASDVGTSVGTSVNPLIIENNPLVYGDEGEQTLTTALTNILNALSTFSYRPYTIQTYGNPCLPIGTNIVINTKKYDAEQGYQPFTINSIVKSRVLTGIQGMMDSLSATGKKDRGSEVNSLQSQVNRTMGKIHRLTIDVERFESEVEDAFEQTNSKIEQTASEIEMAVNGLDVISSYLAETKSGSESSSKIGYFANSIGDVSDEVYENLISTVFKPSSGISPTYTTLSNYYPDYEDYIGMYVAQNLVLLNTQGGLRFDTPVENSGWDTSGNSVSGTAVSYKEITIDLSDDDKFVDFIPEENINATFRTTFTEVWNNTITGYCFIRLKLPALNSSLSVRDAYIFPVYYKGQILSHESEFQPIQGNEYYLKIIPYSEISDAKNPFGFKYVMAFLDEDSTTEWYTSQFQMLKDRIVLSVNSSNKVVAVELGVDPSTSTSLFQVTADNINLSGANIDLNADAGITITSPNFSVTRTGVVTCHDLAIDGGSIDLGSGLFTVSNAGSMHAESGDIGGFVISSNSLDKLVGTQPLGPSSNIYSHFVMYADDCVMILEGNKGNGRGQHRVKIDYDEISLSTMGSSGWVTDFKVNQDSIATLDIGKLASSSTGWGDTGFYSINNAIGCLTKCGTVVRQNLPAQTSYMLFTDSQVAQILGKLSSDATNTTVYVCNGDRSAQSKNIVATYHWNNGSSSGWWVDFDGTTAAGNYRFNYIICYHG